MNPDVFKSIKWNLMTKYTLFLAIKWPQLINYISRIQNHFLQGFCLKRWDVLSLGCMLFHFVLLHYLMSFLRDPRFSSFYCRRVVYFQTSSLSTRVRANLFDYFCFEFQQTFRFNIFYKFYCFPILLFTTNFGKSMLKILIIIK